jgi:hypothetical protein
MVMNFEWIPYPREGTTVLDGDWLATVSHANPMYKKTEVMIVSLEDGEWFDTGSQCSLPFGSLVVAIAHIPQAYLPYLPINDQFDVVRALCKWCGGQQHGRKDACPALDHN